jgi:hypothetical protein
LITLEQAGIVILAVTSTIKMFWDRKTLQHISKVGDDTHSLSNSAMGVVLKNNAIKSQKIYVLTKRISELSKEASDLAAVEIAQAEWIAAERSSGKHEGQQEFVDSGSAGLQS